MKTGTRATPSAEPAVPPPPPTDCAMMPIEFLPLILIAPSLLTVTVPPLPAEPPEPPRETVLDRPAGTETAMEPPPFPPPPPTDWAKMAVEFAALTVIWPDAWLVTSTVPPSPPPPPLPQT